MEIQHDYCREKAAPAGSNVHYAILFEPEELKHQLLPVFALHYEISACLTASTDPGVTRMKLEWWSEELIRLSEAKPRHPITLSLQSIINKTHVSNTPLLKYLATINAIIARQSIATINDWFDKLTRGMGQIWLFAASLSVRENSPSGSLIQTNGGTIFLLELLQNLGLYISRGYIFLPDELLEQHEYNKYELVSDREDGSTNAMFKILIDRLEQQLDTCHASLLKDKGNTPDYNLIMNRLAKNVCIEIRLDGYQLLRHRIALTPVRKLWIATRTHYYK